MTVRGFTRLAAPVGYVDDYHEFVMDAVGTRYLDGRRWFHCARCRSVYVGGPVEYQTVADETRAVREHERTCRPVPATAPKQRGPFGHIDGLDDDDLAWLNLQLAAAQIEPTQIEPATAAPAGGRIYLKCGHQIGGPFGIGPRTCETCLAWIAENPDLAAAADRPAPTPARPARRSQWRQIPVWMLVVAAVCVLGMAFMLFQALWIIAGIIGALLGLPTMATFILMCLGMGVYTVRMLR